MSPSERQHSFRAHDAAVAALVKRGTSVPVSLATLVPLLHDAPSTPDRERWRAHMRALITRCDELVLAPGVYTEGEVEEAVALARAHALRVTLLD